MHEPQEVKDAGFLSCNTVVKMGARMTSDYGMCWMAWGVIYSRDKKLFFRTK